MSDRETLKKHTHIQRLRAKRRMILEAVMEIRAESKRELAKLGKEIRAEERDLFKMYN